MSKIENLCVRWFWLMWYNRKVYAAIYDQSVKEKQKLFMAKCQIISLTKLIRFLTKCSMTAGFFVKKKLNLIVFGLIKKTSSCPHQLINLKNIFIGPSGSVLFLSECIEFISRSYCSFICVQKKMHCLLESNEEWSKSDCIQSYSIYTKFFIIYLGGFSRILVSSINICVLFICWSTIQVL